MNPCAIVAASKTPQLRPAPIDPDWIEAGSPQASNAVLVNSDDRGACAILWQCTAGRFTWRYDFDETLHILEGSAIISGPGMPGRRFGPGDTLYFPRGARATWVVEDYVRKIAFCRKVPPRPLVKAARAARGVLRRLSAIAPIAGGGASLMRG